MITKIFLIGVLLQPRILPEPLNIIKKVLPGRALRDTTRNYIVIHNDGSSMNAAATRLTLRLRGLAYHYFISRSGELYQFKDLKYRAEHAGTSDYLGMKKWNDFSIGICLQGSPTTTYTEEQYSTLEKLVKYIKERYPDSINKPVVFHSDIAYPRGRKADPGMHFDISKLGKQG